MATWASSIKKQLLEAGYSVEKDVEGWWHLKEGNLSILSHRQQGKLLWLAAQEMGL